MSSLPILRVFVTASTTGTLGFVLGGLLGAEGFGPQIISSIAAELLLVGLLAAVHRLGRLRHLLDLAETPRAQRYAAVAAGLACAIAYLAVFHLFVGSVSEEARTADLLQRLVVFAVLLLIVYRARKAFRSRAPLPWILLAFDLAVAIGWTASLFGGPRDRELEGVFLGGSVEALALYVFVVVFLGVSALRSLALGWFMRGGPIAGGGRNG